MDSATIFIGNIAHCNSDSELEVFNGFIVVEKGQIKSVGKDTCVEEICQKLELTKYFVTELTKNQVLIPGFVDCHLHAPQFPNLGLGLDRPLLDWLSMYTYPLEKQYDDIKFATSVFKNVVRRTLKNGTTTACYFSCLQLDSSLALVDEVVAQGQRALVGKVSMNLPNEADYYNNTEDEINDTEKFIKKVREIKNDLVEPIVTPRFAVTCDSELMKRLANLAETYDCRIQSHVSENVGEVELVKELYPNHESYCDIYYKTGLLTHKCVLAHGVYLEEGEMALLAARGTSIAHCPASNTRLYSGLCPVRKLMERGVIVGLGTDVSGGDSPSILDAMRRCMDVSTHINFTKGDSKETKPLTWMDAFYLATLGGARALSLDDKIGNFESNKDFDALLIDLECTESPIDMYQVPAMVESHHPKTEKGIIHSIMERFIYVGDDRNIIKIFVKGKEIVF